APKGGISDQKTALAVPRLNQEAVAAQSAKIDAVSGATYTSGGYTKSLQSALDKVKSGDAKGGSAGGSAGGSSSSGSGSGAAQARTVTGKVAETQYGPVQVRITVSGGKVTKAEA
ncbi:FMN-binding protein, partial [Streptomyces anandii]|uniref:FMN-binding protein n=1 Tax=Streptomyces anandii TaxID=285454 RepID=UPI001E38AD7C